MVFCVFKSELQLFSWSKLSPVDKNAVSFIAILKPTWALHTCCCIIYDSGKFPMKCNNKWHFYLFWRHKFHFFRWNMNGSSVINKLNLLRSAYSVKITSPFLFYQCREVSNELNSPCGFSPVTVFHGLWNWFVSLHITSSWKCNIKVKPAFG